MKIWNILTKGGLKRNPTPSAIQSSTSALSAGKTSPAASAATALTNPMVGSVDQAAAAGPTIKPQIGGPAGKEVPLPPRIVTHIAAVLVTTPKDSEEADWWSNTGGLHLFRSLDPAFASALEARGSRVSFQTVLISRSPGSAFQGDQGTIAAASDLLGKAKDTSTVLFKAGLARAAFFDGGVRDVGFVFAIAFPPPPRVQPWVLMVAANRPLVPRERVVMPRSDGSVSEVDAQQLYPPSEPPQDKPTQPTSQQTRVPTNSRQVGQSELRDLFRELVALSREGLQWGRENGYPRAANYPQYARVRRIGELIYEQAGVEGMREACKILRGRLTTLDASGDCLAVHCWDGIGGWMP